MSQIRVLIDAVSIALMWQCLPVTAKQCFGGGTTQGSLFLQAEMRQNMLQAGQQDVATQNVSSARADNARFLMMASFGPTREELNILSHIGKAQWIEGQMQLPVESHREHYRLRVNPGFDAKTEAGGYFSSRAVCSPGSRWRNFALSQMDQWKTIEVRNSSIFVGGGFRTDVLTGVLASRWAGIGNYSGYVCFVEEHVGGDVHISTDSRCWRDKMDMPNPAVYVTDARKAVITSLPFTQLRPGTLLLSETALPCNLDEGLQGNRTDALVIQTSGRFYTYDPRVELIENTAGNPARTLCPAVTFLNEHACNVQQAGPEGSVVQGLLAEVHPGSGPSFISEEFSRPIASFIDQEINHPATSQAWSQRFPRDHFGVQWKGSLSIQQAGEYEFYLDSDDGSRLYIDSVPVIENGGWHGMREKKGSRNLTQGNHSILVEFFEGGGAAGIIFSWSGADSNNEKSVVPGKAFFTKPPRWSTDCFLPCGSPGEVANNPNQGHLFSMYTTRDHASRDFDNRFFDRMDSKLSKSTVWAAKALGGKDQLRQRMSWALSQIFVVSSQGFGSDERTEMWLNYYDIFVRNAFGNFRDILKAVTFSPLMGRYLTHTGSSSFDYNKRFPNENYAREIMQLFTIGLERLSVNGSIQKDGSGQDIPTYSMDHIMNFARVFTGFQEQSRRDNIEFRGNDNLIDPLRIDWVKHDVHPKPDLNGGFLGDSYPLCNESLQELFLLKGARYEFFSYDFSGAALELHAGALFDALCAKNASECTFPAVVVLESNLVCSGNECGAIGVEVVKLGDLFYSHTPPPCVQNYLDAWEGAHTSNFYMKEEKDSICTEGAALDDPQETVFVLHENEHCGWNSINDRWAETNESTNYGNSSYTNASECQAICAAHTECAGFVRRESDQICSFWKRGPLSRHSRAGHQCYEKVHADCEEGVNAVFGSHNGKPWYGSSQWLPKGCSYRNGKMHFNIHAEGRKSSHYEPVCRAHVVVHEEGKVSVSGVEPNSFVVPWTQSAPPSGLHFVRIEERLVFDRVPSSNELRRQLMLGAYPPQVACSTNCSGEVKAYNEVDQGSAITASTVFEFEGRYFRNIQRLVHTASGQAFRSPPVFLKKQRGKRAEQAALAEVECLLDHLFRHENTPVFIGRRLIQRFGNSNPSAAYLEAVGNAFREGHHGSMHFSGRYGDLAAAVAAILLHEDAQMAGPLGLQGSLREPILKIIHLMRSMEYKDVADEHVVFSQLQDVVGQFPYQSPTVFNFYLANFGLPAMMSSTQQLPELEPEPEPEPEPLVSPELQIFTPPHFIGFLNGASSLIKSGVSYNCDGGKGLGVRSNKYDGLTFRETCPQGHLDLVDLGDEHQMLDELDILLTGGRLTAVSREVLRVAYVGAPPAQRIQRAQQAILLTPEFHTLGTPLPKEEPRPEKTIGVVDSPRPYKASVILFLAGGADTWNLLVPQQCDLYQEYIDVRTDLALSSDDLIPINVAGQGQPCDHFGIHGQFSFLKELYDQQEAIFFTNIGSLVEPTSKEQIRNQEAQLCAGLYSHSDQQTAAQTLKCQTMGNSPLGVGGRIADALASGSKSYSVSSFSLAGSAIFAQGVETNRQIVDGAGNKRFHEYEMWREAISNITRQQYQHIFSEQYTTMMLDAIESTEDLGRAFENVKLSTAYQTRTSLEKQLQQVAKLVKVRDARKAERDFFFVQIGGWDMHSNMKNSLASRFAEINRALQGFVAEMKAQQIWDSVILATTSEFARTLDSNGGGSDHAWGGQQFLIGGALKGGAVLNTFPTSLKEGGYNDLGRGRLIPKYPWESMMLPIAEWMGLDASDQDALSAVFPNLRNFNATFVRGVEAVFKTY